VVIDFHTHIFPPDFIDERASLIRHDAAFASLYSSPKATMATAEDLISSMDEAGIDQSVALGFAWRDPVLCRRHSEYLAESAVRFSGRIVPFGIVNPAQIDDDVPGNLVAQSFRGIGELRPTDQGYALDSTAGNRLASAAKAGKVLLFHVSEPVGHHYPGKTGLDIGQFYRFLTNNPGIPVVGAHWAGGLPLYAAMPEVRAVFDHAYVDTAATSLLYQPSIFEIVIGLIGAKRILFGSDFPLLSQRGQLARLSAVEMSGEDRRSILGENAASLVGLDRDSEAYATT
jgi:predicted TIM-barrel fold metal-dependent hydrolase